MGIEIQNCWRKTKSNLWPQNCFSGKFTILHLLWPLATEKDEKWDKPTGEGTSERWGWNIHYRSQLMADQQMWLMYISAALQPLILVTLPSTLVACLKEKKIQKLHFVAVLMNEIYFLATLPLVKCRTVTDRGKKVWICWTNRLPRQAGVAISQTFNRFHV